MKVHCIILFLLIAFALPGQGIEGVWKTIDDETGQAKSHIEIRKNGEVFEGTVVKLLPAATRTHCEGCPGDKAGKPILGMTVLEGLRPYKDYYSYGEIFDPAKGKTYKCSAWLKDENTLEVRGYIGISLIGRTQQWFRVK